MTPWATELHINMGKVGTGEMVHQVKVLAAMASNLSLISRPQTVD